MVNGIYEAIEMRINVAITPFARNLLQFFIGAVNLLSDASVRHLMGSRTKRALGKSKRPILTQLLLFFCAAANANEPIYFRRDCNYVRLAVIHQCN